MSSDSHTLHTYVGEPAGPDIQRVYWRVGGRIGLVEITLQPSQPVSDAAVTAELAALQFLLSEKEIMGHNRTGKGVIVEVSRGAIRKLVAGTSNKRDLVPYAIFLKTRYHEASITVGRKTDWVPVNNGDIEVDPLTVTEPRPEVIETPSIGAVAITYHALEQYEERFNEGELSRSWASLTKRLQNPDLAKVALPEKVRKHKLRTYAESAETWRHPDGTLHFVVVGGADGVQSLVTVFFRTETVLERST